MDEPLDRRTLQRFLSDLARLGFVTASSSFQTRNWAVFAWRRSPSFRVAILPSAWMTGIAFCRHTGTVPRSTIPPMIS